MNTDKNNIEQRLNDLLATAGKKEPLLEKEKVHLLINNANAKAFPGKQLVNYLNKHLKIIIMTTIVSSIIIGTAIWLNSQTQPYPEKNTMHELQGNQVLQELSKTISSNKGEKRMTEKYAGIFTMDSDSLKIAINSHVQRDEQNNNTGSSFLQPVSGDEYLLSLSFQELCNLGFRFQDTSFYFYNHCPDNIYMGMIYWDNKPGQKAPGRNKLMSRFSSTSADSHKDYPYTDQDYYPVYLTERRHRQIVYLPGYTKDSPTYNLIVKTSLDINSLFEFYNDTLVPINIYLDKSDSLSPNFGFQKRLMNQISGTVYWFKPTHSFYEALPARMREKTMSFYEKMKVIKKQQSQATVNLVDYEFVNPGKKQINSFEKLELNRTELKKLGFIFLNKSLEYGNKVTERNYLFFHFDSARQHFTSTSRIDNSRIRKIDSLIANTQNQGISTPKPYISFASNPPLHIGFFPVFVTTPEGEILNAGETVGKLYGEKDYDSFEKKFLENINRLIPILVRKEMVDGKSLRNDIIFWFPPSEAFFDSLPPEIGKEIRQEYHALLIKDDPNVSPEVKAQVQSNCKYFEECRLNVPALKELRVYPNPANDIINVDIKLDAPAAISILLFDINGRLIQYFKTLETTTEGLHQYSFSVDDLSKGIYILAVRDKNGNTKTQRIIKH